MGIPNLKNFWDALKLAWLSRLFQAHEDCTWKRLAMSKISFSLRIPQLTLTRLLEQGPDSIFKAAKGISNPFWQAVLVKLPQLEKTFYTKNHFACVGERVVWDNSDFLLEGKPFSRKANGSTLTHHFNTLNQFISTKTHVLMSEEEGKPPSRWEASPKVEQVGPVSSSISLFKKSHMAFTEWACNWPPPWAGVGSSLKT